MQATRLLFTCIAIVLVASVRVQAQEPLAAARELYAAADYEKALTLLDELATRPEDGARRAEVDLYRALCLLAVGRADDADRTVETIVRRDPMYQPPEDIAPRMRAAFGDAKKRLLPAIVQQHYHVAKAAYDAKDFGTAANGFQRVLDTLADPDLGHAAGEPPLSDLRTLAAGFLDLSATAAAPPPPPVAALVALPPPVAPALKIYTGVEPGIMLPITIRQELPKFPGRVPAAGMFGALDIVIDQDGTVESAVMRTSVMQSYDAILMRAAQSWRYQPARANGVPVKFRKTIQITVIPDP